jgi:GT2 family glycosyltransferase
MSKPDLSVIVTTYERPQQLARLLRTLAAQDYPKDRFEVIVVNDGGAENLSPIILRFEPDLQMRLIQQQNRGPGAARNAGVAEALGDVIVFTDDDCEPEPGWLKALGSGAGSYRGCLLGGKTVLGLPGNLCSAASQLVVDIVYDFYNADPENARFFASNNMALPAEAFRSIGGFDARFRIASEDRDLCERWRLAGRRMVFLPDAVVQHSHRLTLAGFVRQHFRYGRGAALFRREHLSRGSEGLRLLLSFHRHWYRWLARPWRERAGVPALTLTLLLLIWQAANLAGFLYGWLMDRDPRA